MCRQACSSSRHSALRLHLKGDSAKAAEADKPDRKLSGLSFL